MALGDGERQLLVVFDLVGLKDHRCVLVGFGLAADSELRQGRGAASDSTRSAPDRGKGRAFQ